MSPEDALLNLLRLFRHWRFQHRVPFLDVLIVGGIALLLPRILVVFRDRSPHKVQLYIPDLNSLHSCHL